MKEGYKTVSKPNSSEVLPPFGMAGVSIAGILVCVSIANIESDDLEQAIWWLSISLPVAVSSVMLKLFRSTYKEHMVKSAMIFSNLFKLVGDAFSIIGLFYLINYVSSEAAGAFKVASIVMYLCTNFLTLFMEDKKPRDNVST
ncbi:hypothetical protein [Vibrio diabolicus]|uniref:hypothetical protein n=1 Tax=Vibrio diabolicus TaxID=50719 RepID=UPI0014287608|nr:hypothetical protein [Vibrio diabolicus]QIR97472.1 hypothetical protein FR741_06730 [Vibrio diabolicus]